MDIVQWRPNYSTMVEEFDAEHRQIIGLINRLYNGLTNGEEDQALRDVLAELVDYAQKHFLHEERLMQRFCYPEYEQHKQEHDSFRNTIEDFNSLAEKDGSGLGMPLLKILREWLVNHILEVDSRYGQFFNDKGVR